MTTDYKLVTNKSLIDVASPILSKEGAMLRKALRKLNFWDISIKLYEDDETRATFLTAEKFFGAQPLYPEIIVGSKWTWAI